MTTEVLEKLAKQIAKRKIRVVDLTQTLRPSTPVIQLPPAFAPSNPFSISQISHYDDKGPAWYWNNISCGEHTGTHFDAPIHWVTGKDYRDGATDTIDVQRFVAPACGRNALLAQRRDNQVGEADGGGAGAEKEDPLLFELAAGDLERIDQARQRDAARALNVVIVAADLFTVAGERRAIASVPVQSSKWIQQFGNTS